MRGTAGCVLLLSLALCSAASSRSYLEGSDLDAFQATDLTVGGISAEDVGFLGLLQEYDLADDEDDTQQTFTVWPSTTLFLDSSLQSWVDQQITVFDSLRGALVSPCPHAAAVATPPQSDYPSLLSYMATSRFGPATLTAYARQVDQDLQPAGFSISVSGTGADLDSVFDESEPLMSAWAVEEEPEEYEAADAELEESLNAGFQPRSLDVTSWFGIQQDADVQASAAVEQDSSGRQQLFQGAAWDPNSMRVDTVEDAQGAPVWGDACNFIVFAALCVGCIFVWIGLVRAWISCCRLEDQAQARKAAAQQFATNPLLAPLVSESFNSNPAYAVVEVAADHSPQGTFMAPRGTEFTTIAYMPLPSEMGMQK
ncbi:hypothetical protein WJX73_009810 [Symbiochloris irregularis]|uniref:Uncharacterized protein n=1 Tax=Symbiochloris irregularis TaxID=706552 RepID=A0AAW1P822_9CHLO